jgi:hypothetical protein
VTSKKEKPLMASVTIDVDFRRLPHLVRALMVEEEDNLKDLAAGFRENVIEALRPGSSRSQYLNVSKALRRVDEFRKSLSSVDAQLEQQYNLLLAYYRKESSELLEDKQPKQQAEDGNDSSEALSEEEYTEKLAVAEKFNKFAEKMEDSEEAGEADENES